MVNTQISWWRRQKLDVYPTEQLPDRPVADDHTDQTEMRDALSRALQRLPERQRLTVILRYYEDMSEREIAQILGVSVGTVKSTVSRAITTVRNDEALLSWPPGRRNSAPTRCTAVQYLQSGKSGISRRSINVHRSA